jgi:hypothetical protein
VRREIGRAGGPERGHAKLNPIPKGAPAEADALLLLNHFRLWAVPDRAHGNTADALPVVGTLIVAMPPIPIPVAVLIVIVVMRVIMFVIIALMFVVAFIPYFDKV